jgi:hypothetical protein
LTFRRSNLNLHHRGIPCLCSVAAHGELIPPFHHRTKNSRPNDNLEIIEKFDVMGFILVQ